MQSHPKQARVKSSNKMCTTGGRNGDTPVFLGQEPYEQYENAKDKTREDKHARPLPPTPARSEGVQYATGEQWRAITYSSRKNEAAGPKWK